MAGGMMTVMFPDARQRAYARRLCDEITALCDSRYTGHVARDMGVFGIYMEPIHLPVERWRPAVRAKLKRLCRILQRLDYDRRFAACRESLQ